MIYILEFLHCPLEFASSFDILATHKEKKKSFMTREGTTKEEEGERKWSKNWCTSTKAIDNKTQFCTDFQFLRFSILYNFFIFVIFDNVGCSRVSLKISILFKKF